MADVRHAAQCQTRGFMQSRILGMVPLAAKEDVLSHSRALSCTAAAQGSSNAELQFFSPIKHRQIAQATYEMCNCIGVRGRSFMSIINTRGCRSERRRMQLACHT